MNIAVIIPTFDREHTLARALNSVLGQTLAPAEILVIDDGSGDATRNLVAAQFPTVNYHYQDNAGVSSARNLGIAESSAEWLAFLDSDDSWFPEKLARQSEQLARSPDHLVCHTDEIWIRNGVRVNQMKKHAKAGGRIFTHCLAMCAISPSSVLIHRSIFEEIGLFDESLPACEDYDLWLRICALHPVLFLEEALITKYGGHDDQLSRRYPAMDRFRINSLERIVDHPALTEDERTAARSTLLNKLDIYISGARKRGHTDQVSEFQARRDAIADVLLDLPA